MPGLLRGMARTAVVAGTATAVSNRVSRRQAGRWAQQDTEAQQQQYDQQQQYAEPAPEPEGPDRIEQLKQLADLHSSGVLTDEEFATEKAKILNS